MQGKEARSTPGRAGDGASDRGEAPICDSLPVEAVADGGDGVAPALILANEDGPRFELARWQAVVSREALQEPQAVAIKAAKSSLLQARGNPTVREAAAVLREGAAGLSEIVLYIVATSSAEGGAAIAAARAQLTRNLPAFKLPRQYALAAQLPRTPSGKIQRYKLRAELQRSA